MTLNPVLKQDEQDTPHTQISELTMPSNAATVPMNISPVPPQEKLDIEHAVVADDPRKWSNTRKKIILFVISGAAMIAGLGNNLYTPAITDIEADLHATSGQFALTLSLYIIIQGSFPLIWSAVSEIYGRKKIYLVSIALCTIGCIVGATAKTIEVLIGMRCIQAAGSSAVIGIGAATLADIYDPHERGTMMGLFYCAPLLGPALGSLIGGALTQGFNWRATFWFLVIFTGLCFVAILFIKDTFRRERSLTYQLVLKHLLKERAARELKAEKSESSSLSHETVVASEVSKIEEKDRKLRSEEEFTERGSVDVVVEKNGDVEAQVSEPKSNEVAEIKQIKLSLKDVNPVRPIVFVLMRLNNISILFASGLIFAYSFSVTYTCARTLSNEYGYNALKVGLVLLAFGIGSILGSVLGGRWSDHIFKKSKAQNGGVSSPEMRLQSTKIFMAFFPPSVIAYGWVCEKHVHVSAICVMLFLAGFLSISIYSSTLAYIVDANTGRSSSAVAANSCFRGVSAFVAAEVAVPLQNSIGDGGLYSIWAGLMVVSELLILLVWWKGGEWRERSERRENQHNDQS